MFEWLSQNYADTIKQYLEDEDIEGYEADIIYNRMMQEWEDGYGDYLYDAKGDR